MESTGHPDRHEVRYPFPNNILLNGKVMVRGIDISMGGLYVHTGREFKRGMIVDVAIPEYRFNAKARVQHSQGGVGMGLKFMGMNDEGRRRLSLLLKSLDTVSPDLSRKSKPEILLIDTNQGSRRINRSRLSMDGLFVLEAKDGVEGIKALGDRVPDIIICDALMEGMDGFKVLGMIRSNPEWVNIPVIMLSSVSSAEMIDRAMDAGADAFLPKGTTTPAKLAEHVKKMLERKK